MPAGRQPRPAAHHGVEEGACNHFSAALPDDTCRLQINPRGLHWSEVGPGDIVLVDENGTVLEGRHRVEPTAMYIHASAHRIISATVVLFIDARKLAVMISRVQCELTREVIDRIAGSVAGWRGDADAGDYADVAGCCRSVTLAVIAEHGHVLRGLAGAHLASAYTSDSPNKLRWRHRHPSSISVGAHLVANLRSGASAQRAVAVSGRAGPSGAGATACAGDLYR